MADRRQGAGRYFFVALSLVYALVAVVGFAPESRDLFSGKFEFTFIPAVAYVHGALMMAWLLLFVVQTSFVASGALKWHRTLGLSSIGLAAAMWISMGVVTVGQLVWLTRSNTEVEGWVYDVVPNQIYSMGLFALFYVWGIRARRDSSSHKRLLTLAALVLLQPAVDRMVWLPHFGLPYFWPYAIRTQVLLIPLLVFDLATIKRIHPITLIGTGVILAAHTALSLILATPGWHTFAQAMTNVFR
jgi:hypothetical protein